jgi:sulfite reductase beta subunit-like hemoprotein
MNRQSNAVWTFRVSPTAKAELDEFQAVVTRFQAGQITEGQFRAIRVPLGVYEQRENSNYMLRVRFPAGGVSPSDLRCLARVSEKFGNGILHITTRQEFQIHRVPLASIIPAQRALAEAGLSTKGGGGNTVRNIVACPDSAVCSDAIFDVEPQAIAATERLLADPLSLQLPRKYKLAFAACGKDCCGATVQDLGFIARKQNGAAGFAVYVAGGMGGKAGSGVCSTILFPPPTPGSSPKPSNVSLTKTATAKTNTSPGCAFSSRKSAWRSSVNCMRRSSPPSAPRSPRR